MCVIIINYDKILTKLLRVILSLEMLNTDWNWVSVVNSGTIWKLMKGDFKKEYVFNPKINMVIDVCIYGVIMSGMVYFRFIS